MHNINTLQKKEVKMWKFETSLCVNYLIVLLFVFLNRFLKKLTI